MQEYTRLVSSTFWQKLEDASVNQRDWNNTEEMIRYLTDPGQSSSLSFVVARSLQRRFPDELPAVTPAGALSG